MAASYRISSFSSVAGVLFLGATCGAVAVACSDEDSDVAASSNETADAGISTNDSGASSDDSGASSDDSGATIDAGTETTADDAGSPTYTIGGNVTGLTGSGLVLQNNAGDDLSVTAAGPFTLATALADHDAYAVTIASQPKDPSQTCTLTNDSGTVSGQNVTQVEVTCTTNTYTIGGTASGVVTTGLVVTNNGGDDKAIDASGAFTFPTSVASGAAYSVAVKSSPAHQTCTVTAGTNSGSVVDRNIDSVAITCSTTVCGASVENTPTTVTCPSGQTIAAVDFASFGLPTGDCGAYTASAICDSATSVEVVKGVCLGQATCTVNATNGNFGDPCSGVGKHLYIQATCK